VHRCWERHCLRVPRRTIRRRRLGMAENGVVHRRAERVDHMWTYDFVSDQTAAEGPDGHLLCLLNPYFLSNICDMALDISSSVMPEDIRCRHTRESISLIMRCAFCK